jgi:hypothetical protein
MPWLKFFVPLKEMFYELNPCFSFLIGPAGNPQVPAKFRHWYLEPEWSVGKIWSGSAGAWSAGIFLQVTCQDLRITRTRGVPYFKVPCINIWVKWAEKRVLIGRTMDSIYYDTMRSITVVRNGIPCMEIDIDKFIDLQAPGQHWWVGGEYLKAYM